MAGVPWSDEQLLFLLMGLFYVLECGSVLQKPACCFCPGWRGYRRAEPSSCLASGDRGVLVHGVLPFQQSFQCQPWPWAMDEHGILLPLAAESTPDLGPTRASLRLVRYEDLRELSVFGSQLVCGAEIRLSCPSPRFARGAWRRICQIRETAPADRVCVIQSQLTASFDAFAVQQQYRRFRRRTGPLRLASSAWALWAIGSLALGSVWPQVMRSEVACLIVGGGFVLFWMLTGATLIRANRALQVSQGSEWSQHLCQVLLTPTAAMRSPDWLSRHLFAEADPLALAATLGSSDLFRAMTQQRLRMLLSPLPEERPPAEDIPAVRAFTTFRGQVFAAIAELITAQGESIEELLRPPRRDSDAASYCPRCRGQYVRGVESCPVCTGVLLQPF